MNEMHEATNHGDDTEPSPDEDLLAAWDEVKGDYQVEPGGDPVPNSMDVKEVLPIDGEDQATPGT